MWGSRRKRDTEENSVPPPSPRSFDIRQTGGVVNSAPGKKAVNDQVASTIEEFANMYIEFVEEMMKSEDFDKLVTPESIQGILQQFPGMAANPEVAELFQSPQLQDPEVLKQTLREGLNTVKAAIPELLNLINDPIRMAELMEQLPPEMQLLVEGMRTGDMSMFRSLVDNLPGLDSDQKAMLKSLMDGNTDILTDQLQKVLGDSDQIEAARQQFLESPEMAEALGIPMEVLNDPKQWASLMSQGMDALTSQLEEDPPQAPTKNKQFGRFNKAAA